MLKDDISFVWKNFKSRKLRSYLTMLGIVIGVAAIVALIGLGDGLRAGITAQFNLLGPNTITISGTSGQANGPPGAGVVTPLRDKYIDRISAMNGVEWVVGRNIKTARIMYNDQLQIKYLGTYPDGEFRKDFYEALNLDVEKGRMLQDGDVGKVVLGSNYLDKEKFGKEIRVGSNILVNDKKFQVVGFLKKKGSFITDDTIGMNPDDLRDMYDLDDELEAIVVNAKEGYNLNTLEAAIERYLRKERDVKEGEEDFSVETAAARLESMESTLLAVQIFVYIVAGISLLVGGIGIGNSMYTSVIERTKQIGIMKAIGARNSQIFKLFFIESGMLGLIGGGIGAFIGFLMALAATSIMNNFLGLEVSSGLTIAHILGALLFSFSIGVISGFAPAYLAAKLHPVEAMRD